MFCALLLLVLSITTTAIGRPVMIRFSDEGKNFVGHKNIDMKESAYRDKVTNEMEKCDRVYIEKLSVRPIVLRSYHKETGWTPLHYMAAYCGVTEMETLLNAGADVNALGHDLETPIALAMLNNKIENVNYLYSKGATLSLLTRDKWTMIHLATKDPKGKMLDFMFKRYPELINNIDQPGGEQEYTPLMIAVLLNNVNAVKVLLRNGASDLVTDAQGNSAMILASYEMNQEIINLIKHVATYRTQKAKEGKVANL